MAEQIGGSGNDVFNGVGQAADSFSGNGGNDTLNGNGGKDTLFGGSDNDSLNGGNQDDLLSGNDGDDVLDGGTGKDTMLGGLGFDRYFVDDVGDVVTEAVNEGPDVVVATVSYTLPSNVEELFLSLTNGVALPLNGDGNSLANTMTGNGAANQLRGLGGNDVIFGGGGNDRIEGGAGNDRLEGDAGADVMIGGTGDDSFEVDNTGDSVQESSGEGTDTVFATISYTLPVNFENLDFSQIFTLGTSVTGRGNNVANRLIGSRNADTLEGRGGNDTLQGGAGNDNYVFGVFAGGLVLSFGSDTVSDTSGGSTLFIGNGLTRIQSDQHVGTSRVLTFAGDDTITIQNHFAGATGTALGSGAITNIVFGAPPAAAAIRSATAAHGAGGEDAVNDGGFGASQTRLLVQAMGAFSAAPAATDGLAALEPMAALLASGRPL